MKFRISEHVRWTLSETGGILMDRQSGHFYSVSPVGIEAIERISRGEDMSVVIEAISGKYQVTKETVSQDLENFFQNLRTRKLIVDAEKTQKD
jgi:hypothetical protein